METTEEYLADLLSRFPDERAILIIRNGNMSNVGPTTVSDIRKTATRHKLPFYETPSFIAIAQYDVMNDQTVYRVVRK